MCLCVCVCASYYRFVSLDAPWPRRIAKSCRCFLLVFFLQLLQLAATCCCCAICFCWLWIFALALSSVSCTNRSRARHKTFMAVLFSFWSRKKRRCREREREKERNIGSKRARPELCVGHWPLAAAADAHRNYMMMYVYTWVCVCVCVCLWNSTHDLCQLPPLAACLPLECALFMRLACLRYEKYFDCPLGTAKAEVGEVVESKLKAMLVDATHACNTLHKQRINQATRCDANVAITWSLLGSAEAPTLQCVVRSPSA